MNKIIEHVNTLEKEFDKEFQPFTTIGIEGFSSLHLNLKSFFRNSIISVLEKEITELEEKKKKDPREYNPKYKHLDIFGYNVALDELISERKEVTKGLRE